MIEAVDRKEVQILFKMMKKSTFQDWDVTSQRLWKLPHDSSKTHILFLLNCVIRVLFSLVALYNANYDEIYTFSQFSTSQSMGFYYPLKILLLRIKCGCTDVTSCFISQSDTHILCFSLFSLSLSLSLTHFLFLSFYLPLFPNDLQFRLGIDFLER